ncbi:LytR/AlgR family response regulator transcription factor [Emticicia agri]|uniref:Response regulator transcription factor n=1 Tax=Emticicia agri TaxID=2492393 RepID=A0A4Q5M1E1_9BACT|nr:LytTR family DNA-binding domain-containing protein [Emticicia agri]RYU96012.1 response regulator transcription factor [Emticicia agri]
MIKALLVDDEVSARNLLSHYLKTEVPEVSEIRLADSVDSALEILQHYQPDIVFLDIEMPERNGFDFLIACEQISFDIIFVTAYNQYAIKAIRFSALDYLLKPVDTEELTAAIARHLEKRGTNQQALYENLKQNLKNKEEKEFQLAVPTTEGIFFFRLENLIRLEANGSYTLIYSSTRKPFLASKNLKYFEETLDNQSFIRPHKSHLVNLKYITGLSADKDFLVLQDNSQVEISRRKKEEILTVLGL